MGHSYLRMKLPNLVKKHIESIVLTRSPGCVSGGLQPSSHYSMDEWKCLEIIFLTMFNSSSTLGIMVTKGTMAFQFPASPELL